MAGIYPDAADVILKRSPNALVICETYSHFLDEQCKFFNSNEPNEHLRKILNMPKSVFWQWKCDARLRDGNWTKDDKMLLNMSKFNHVMRAHSGTQWWGGRAAFAVEKIRRQCYLSYESGINGVSMFGENAPFHTNAEFNYLALEYFSDNPRADISAYISDVMAPRLGGKSFAEYYYESAGLTENISKIPDAVSRISKITAEICDYETLRRWQYLASFLNGYYWEAQQSGDIGEFVDSDNIGEEK